MDLQPAELPRQHQFDRLLENEIPILYRFAGRFIRNDADREDLVQDTLVRALRSSHQFTPGTSLRSWLFTIMRNCFCSGYRKRSRELVGIDDDLAELQWIAAPQEWAIRKTELNAAIARLPTETRRTLVMVSSGVSYIDTAKRCKCEIGTVKSRVNRARTSLMRELGPIH